MQKIGAGLPGVRQPREDLWVADRIHPNHEGYLIRVRLTTRSWGRPTQIAGSPLRSDNGFA